MLLVFIPYGVEFTKKRADIMKEQVEKRSGRVVAYDFFSWEYHNGTDTYIIVNRLMSWKVTLDIGIEVLSW